MRMNKSRLCLAISTLTACIAFAPDLTPPPDPVAEGPGPVVTVDRSAYRWSVDSAVVVTVTNDRDVPVYYRACLPYNLDRYEAGWQHSPLPYGCPAGEASSSIRRLAAGGSTGMTLPLTNDVFPTSGWYRVEFHAYRDSTMRTPWGQDSRVSPAFRVGP